MTDLNIAEIAALAGLSFVIAFSVLWAISVFYPRKTASARAIINGADQDIVFVFDEDQLIDATPPARKLLQTAESETGRSDWDKLIALLSPRFPTISQDAAALFEKGKIKIVAADENDDSWVDIEWWDNLARVSIIQSVSHDERSLMDGPSVNAMTDELGILRSVVNSVPYLMWKQDDEQNITWANKAYTDLAIEHSEPSTAGNWPIKSLFETLPALLEDDGRRVWRASLQKSNNETLNWFEIESFRHGDQMLFSATGIDATIRAEQSLRDFVQTLSKTFAQLPTGLAIFNQKRQLVLFNPALLNLVGLSAEFLSIRPTLFAFLDKLREKQMVPEPKDYRSWQQQISDLEAAAIDGTYAEIWNLPSGLTYRVTGRPHPGGGVAFLFEDISAEVSLTRRFRSQLDQGQAVIDSMGEAIIVFASNGMVALSNQAYKKLWALETERPVVEVNAQEALAHWEAMLKPSENLLNIRAFISQTGNRSALSMELALNTGPVLKCRLEPIQGGATLVGFTETQAHFTPKQSIAL
ncbi:PAS-domain containing protein [Parasulfitobacter algicola]|uniref:PAS-domain containing protein n=1 Tax=Parasulfitobacter algicola TaxID=2614809 RepID=A0ABX2IMM9_9RHOB|nr:PAS-domain containing protein [Sulfitobacter algicola]NSX53600.1 PAS-domain containing protein [Sulfitobacter algicola]